MDHFREQVLGTLGQYLPSVLGALAVLIVGWVVARLISSGVRRLLEKTSLDDKLGRWLSGDTKSDVNWGNAIAQAVYYILMIVVLVGCFQVLGLTLVTEPMSGILDRVVAVGTNLLAAAALFLVAWVVAALLRAVVARGLGASGIDQKLGERVEDDKTVPVSKSLSEAAYWLTFLFFAPAILGVMGLEGLLQPVQDLTHKLLNFLPQILGASLIFLIGWFIARILQRVVSSLLAAAGLDKVGESAGLGRALGNRQLSGVVGAIVYTLVLIPVLIAALNALALDAVTVPASEMLSRLLEAIPLIFAAALLLVISYIVARLVGGLVSNLLSGIGFDTVLSKLGLGSTTPAEGRKTPSEIVGVVVVVAILLFASTEAAALLGFHSLSMLISELTYFGGEVIFGLIIFSLGLWLANIVAGTVQSSGMRSSGLLATVARVAIIGVTGAMALRYIVPDSEIVDLAFGLLLGSVAVAAAIAFGWGGRDFAKDQIERWRGKIESGA